jgi:hypothetical protein
MISLLAIAAGSGWAIVRHDDRTYLVRPPYVASNRSEVSDSTVERAISGYGFASASEDFPDWAALVDRLREGIIQVRGQVPAEGEAGMKLLAQAPPAILERYVERVERELIPNGEFRAAMKLLSALLTLDRVKTDPEMAARVANLLARCSTRLDQAERKREELVNDPDILSRDFPKAVARHGGKRLAEFMTDIQRLGRLLPMGT